jgi:hypothetical protein
VKVCEHRLRPQAGNWTFGALLPILCTRRGGCDAATAALMILIRIENDHSA